MNSLSLRLSLGLLSLLGPTACSDAPSQPPSESTTAPVTISLDAEFASDGILRGLFTGTTGYIRSEIAAVHPLSSGKYLVLANITNNSNQNIQMSLSRYNANGTIDTTFASSEPTPGRIIFTIGTTGTEGASLDLQSDGKIIVAGQLYSVAGAAPSEAFVLRTTATGSLDTTFGTSGIFRNAFSYSYASMSAATVTPSDQVLFTGSVFNSVSASRVIVGRLSAAGALDTSFDTDGFRVIDYNFAPDYDADSSNGGEVFLDSAGRVVLVSGGYDTITLYESTMVARLLSSGADDTTFSGDGHLSIRNNNYSLMISAVLTADDQVLLLMDTTDATQSEAYAELSRVTESGTIDTTFGTSGFVLLTPPSGSSLYSGGLVLSSTGRIVVSGLYYGSTSGLGKLFVQPFSSSGQAISAIHSGAAYAVDTISGFDEFVFGTEQDTEGRILVFGREQPPGPTDQPGYFARFKAL